MPNFRRYYVPDAIIFVTCVTQDRGPYLISKRDIDLFLETIAKVKEIHPFDLLAYVILPDHFHGLIRVDDLSGNFSSVMHSIKRNFTLNYKKAHNIQATISLWQSRFWDHVIRDEQDLERHMDYIHWNPVKHGYVSTPESWAYSSFQEWVDRGYYQPGWEWFEAEMIKGMDFE